MSGLTASEKTLLILEAGATAALLFRILWEGLYRIYPFFFAYMAVFFVQELCALTFRMGTNLYGWSYVACEAVILFLYALITLELYSLVLKDLSGLATVARRYVRIALGIATLLSVLAVGIEKTPHGILGYLFSLERPILTSIFCFLFLIAVFLVYYPIPLNRNVILYTIGYAIYFTAKAVTLFLRNTGSHSDIVLGLVMLAVATACLIFWSFALTRSGERSRGTVGGPMGPVAEERLRRQLAAINATLSRGRK